MIIKTTKQPSIIETQQQTHQITYVIGGNMRIYVSLVVPSVFIHDCC